MYADLSKYSNGDYQVGKNIIVQILWYFVNHCIFRSAFFPLSGLKCFILRLFGAKIGNNVNVKPRVNIKYPWHLAIGDNTWIGECVWIDNFVDVKIGSNCCISQDALLLTGSHNYKDEAFSRILKEIVIEDGVWVCARAVVLGGSILKSHCVISASSIISKQTEEFSIYKGNPAIKMGTRIIS